MIDQHSKYAPLGLNTEFISELTDFRTEKKVISEKVQLVYVSPESIINNEKYRRMLLSTAYKDNLVGLVVDEAHCVKTWGNDFRIAFANIGTLRSLIPEHVRVMASTATCTATTVEIITERLSLVQPEVIALSPNWSNIISLFDLVLAWKLSEQLMQDRTMFKKNCTVL